jgi:outer membrane protein
MTTSLALFRRALLLGFALPLALHAQDRTPQTLTLAEAIRMAATESEALRIARAGTSRARGQELQARSRQLPQLNGSVNYQRALQLQVEEIVKRLGGGEGGENGGGGGDGFTDSPIARVFAAPNTMILGLTATQLLYSGGAAAAGVEAAKAGTRVATLGEQSARAQLVLDIAQAYFDAQVAAQMAVIAESSFVQADRALSQTQLGRDVGNVSEFDLIRARVQRDNARPAVIGARTQRDVALLRLRQLLNIPLDRPLVLTTSADEVAGSSAAAVTVAEAATPASADTTVTARIPVQQAAEAVRVQERLLRVARGQRLPAIGLQSTYQRFAYPAEGTILEDNWRFYFPNWTVALGVSMPLFSGGRVKGEVMSAEASLNEARARYNQARQAAELDQAIAIAQLAEAEASLAASVGTDEQAARAYAIAEVRYAEGIATQLELAQTRVDLETARAYRVQATRDVALARLKLALIRDLPLSAGLSLGMAR